MAADRDPIPPQMSLVPPITTEELETTRVVDPDRGWPEFWRRYPKKEHKHESLIAYRKAIRSGASPEMLMVGLEHYIRTKWARRDTDFIELASTWLNGRRFEDADEALQAARDAKRGDRTGMFWQNFETDHLSPWLDSFEVRDPQRRVAVAGFARKVAAEKDLVDPQVILACCLSFIHKQGWMG